MATLKERSWLDIPEPKVMGHVEYEDLTAEQKEIWDDDSSFYKFIEEHQERLKKKHQDNK